MERDDGGACEFFHDLYVRLYRFVFVRTNARPDDVEELVQDSLLHAWRSRSSFSGAARAATWVFSIARHKIADYWRRRKNEPGADAAGVREALDRIDVAPIPDALLDQAETRRQVADALDQLPTPYAEALRLRYLEGLPVPDIARRLSESPSAVESRLTRAREAFRQHLTSQEVIHGEPRA
jgi:RNA polymerase sigma-70 factor (ECF subfamily)